MPRRRKKKTKATTYVGYAIGDMKLSADAAHAHTLVTSAARPAVARARAHPAAGNTGKEEEDDGKGEYIASDVHSPDGKCCFATTSVLYCWQISLCP